MKIALFGGTFDPIHHGHLILAREAREQLGLDRVVFVPAAQSPFKPGIVCAPADMRLSMLRAAIQDEPGFEIDTSELDRKGPSYTIDTVLAARLRWPDAALFWFIGHDHVGQLEKWRRYSELKELVQFVVFARRGSEASAPGLPRVSRQVDISATEVRTRVAQGESIRYLVPEAVRTLIERHGLYRNSH